MHARYYDIVFVLANPAGKSALYGLYLWRTGLFTTKFLHINDITSIEADMFEDACNQLGYCCIRHNNVRKYNEVSRIILDKKSLVFKHRQLFWQRSITMQSNDYGLFSMLCRFCSNKLNFR